MDTRHFGRLARTAIVVLGVAGAFLYLGGWFNPEALTPTRFADGFERVDGIYSGFRLNHAKGVCVSGSFESNGRGTRGTKRVFCAPRTTFRIRIIKEKSLIQKRVSIFEARSKRGRTTPELLGRK